MKPYPKPCCKQRVSSTLSLHLVISDSSQNPRMSRLPHINSFHSHHHTLKLLSQEPITIAALSNIDRWSARGQAARSIDCSPSIAWQRIERARNSTTVRTLIAASRTWQHYASETQLFISAHFWNDYVRYAPYARRAAPDFLRRVREQLEADYVDVSERKIAADLKCGQVWSNSLQYIHL
jgi:hypothetical protein